MCKTLLGGKRNDKEDRSLGSYTVSNLLPFLTKHLLTRTGSRNSPLIMRLIGESDELHDITYSVLHGCMPG